MIRGERGEPQPRGSAARHHPARVLAGRGVRIRQRHGRRLPGERRTQGLGQVVRGAGPVAGAHALGAVVGGDDDEQGVGVGDPPQHARGLGGRHFRALQIRQEDLRAGFPGHRLEHRPERRPVHAGVQAGQPLAQCEAGRRVPPEAPGLRVLSHRSSNPAWPEPDAGRESGIGASREDTGVPPALPCSGPPVADLRSALAGGTPALPGRAAPRGPASRNQNQSANDSSSFCRGFHGQGTTALPRALRTDSPARPPPMPPAP